MTPPWLEADWPAPPGVRVLSTHRHGGVSLAPFDSWNLGDHVGDEAAAVSQNRARLRIAAALPAEPCWLTQVHGATVVDLDLKPPVAPPLAGADAAVTRAQGTVCAILTADCLPVVFAADDGLTVAAAHAGWRGLARGVLEATVAAMGIEPVRLLAWLGPAIGRKHFEVGPEVRAALLDTDREALEAFEPGAGDRFMADLGLLARRRLDRLGVRRIFGGGECTYAHAERYFSHRRDGRTGRQATLIWRQYR